MSVDANSRKNVWTILVAILLLAILGLYTIAFTVPAGQWGVVRTLGAIDPESGIKKDPGLYFKAPWPFQTQQLIDQRLRFFDDPGQEVLTRDMFNLYASLVVGWKVTDPNLYLNKLQNEATAEQNIRTRILNARENAIKSMDLGNLISTDPAQSENFNRFESMMFDNLRASLDEANFGVQVEFLKVKTLRFPKVATETIQRRMAAERRKEAATHKAEGESEASKRRTDAEAEANRQLADAQGAAIALRGTGVAESAQYYRVFSEHPDLAKRLKDYQLLNNAIKPGTTLILSTKDLPGLTEPVVAPPASE